jgi:hypothetical protein
VQLLAPLLAWLALRARGPQIELGLSIVTAVIGVAWLVWLV